MTVGPKAGTEAEDGFSARVHAPGLQNEILEAIATGGRLTAVADLLCRRVEELIPDAICSLLTVDRDGLMHPLAGPSLPDHYSQAIDGVPMGPCVGSCGTAAWRGEPVVSPDIATDPLWADFRTLVLPLGFRACWSSPIKSRDQRVIGTFAFYYRVTRGPTDAERDIVKACVHLSAIAIERDTAQSVIHRLAFFDLITGLPNRASFQMSGTQAVESAIRSGGSIAIHYVDIDDFKGVNNTLGHRTGDLLLEQVADRLKSCLGRDESLARLGGDEFAVLQPFKSAGAVRKLAERIAGRFDELIEVDGHSVAMSVSIGIAQAPDDGRDLSDLLRNAGMALNRAKSDGRGTYAFYASEMFDRARFRQSVERDLRSAVRNGEFELLYQPMVGLADGRLNAFEALIRWRHPTRGIVAPSDFIPLAEEMDLIGPVGDWVVRRACAEAAEWPAGIKIALNLSPLQFRKPGFALKIIKALGETRLPPHRLELEITETVVLAEDGPARAILDQLREIGVGISLDDFGTGYSSLRSLRSFPINKIKIDKSFVHDIGENPGSAAIVRTLVALAHDLGMNSTAEGIESEEQYRTLRSLGCGEGQGYYFSRPMTANEVNAYFEKPRRPGSPTLRAAVMS